MSVQHRTRWLTMEIASLFPRWGEQQRQELLARTLDPDPDQSRAGRITLFEARRSAARRHGRSFPGALLRRVRDALVMRKVSRSPQDQGGSARSVTPTRTPDGPRILHAISDLSVGGAAQLVYDIATESRRAGEQHIAALRALHRSPPGLSVRIHPSSSKRAAARLLRSLAPDLVHVCYYDFGHYSVAWCGAILQAAHDARIPIVQSHCVLGEPWLGGADQTIVFCSEWSERFSGAPWIPSVVIHPGTPFDLFHAPYRPVRPEPVVGMAYRLYGDKIDLRSAHALVEVLAQLPRARLRIAGTGRLEAGFRDLFRRRDLAERVDWVGWLTLEELPAFYQSLDLALAPVISDTFGSCSVHAIAAGRPVVGTCAGALPEILRSPEALTPSLGEVPDGFRFVRVRQPSRKGIPAEAIEPDAARAFGRQAAALLGDPRLHARVHAEQLAHARAHFTVERMVQRYEELFASLI